MKTRIRTPEDLLEITGSDQAGLPGETLVDGSVLHGLVEHRISRAGRPTGRRLYAQALAAFGTTGIEHLPSAFGRHAGTEAMGALALQVARLKGSFHVFLPVVSAILSHFSALLHVSRLRRGRDSMDVSKFCQLPHQASFTECGPATDHPEKSLIQRQGDAS